jgi:two-component system sensor histidine kinase YesM
VGRTYNFYSTLITFLPWLALFALIIVIWLAMLITHPVYTITEFLENPQSRVPDNISAPETQKIIRQIINYVESNQMLSRELQQQMERQNKATFWALQTQINPHFLLNTLNIIRNMEIKTLGYDHEAPEMTLSLSRLLQYALDSTNLVPLKTEFHYTNLYLNILNQRYKNKLHFDIKKEDSISEVLIPKLILQPLIENAVFHGCSPRLDVSNNILVKATCSANTCFITIQDDGIGIPPETLASLRSKLIDIKNIPDSSIGLQNVALRMYLTYGNDFHIDIDSGTNKGTCITLSFPIHL